MAANTWIEKKVIFNWSLLKYTFGLLFVVAGVDKFVTLITRWDHFISPLVINNIPVDVNVFLYGVGIFEIILGLLILTKWTRIGAYIAMIWLLIISANLLTMPKYYDIAVRDTVMAIAAFILAQLTDIKKKMLNKD